MRLDGARLDQWDSDALGRHIGYLPQEVALFDGTVADNICRFEEGASEERILEAAMIAGAHGLIVSLPKGYATPIGEGGALLSAGQRQRLGLARALYGGPFVVVLDEPNANLDAEGEAALTRAIKLLRDARGDCHRHLASTERPRSPGFGARAAQWRGPCLRSARRGVGTPC